MPEHLPDWRGAALRGVRAGAEQLTIVQPVLGSSRCSATTSRRLSRSPARRLPEQAQVSAGKYISPPFSRNTSLIAAIPALAKAARSPSALSAARNVSAG